MFSRAKPSAPIRSLAQIALLPPAAFAVHQLRYMLAFGSGAGLELQRTGHAYLHSLVPWLVCALALAVGAFLNALGRAFARQTSLPRYTLSLASLWLACTTALIAIFICQEFVEGLVLAGHPAGLQGIFGYGGWWAIPAAACLGLVLATLFHGARWAIRTIAERRSRQTAPRGRIAATLPSPRAVLLAPIAPLVAGWSGRGPPV